MNPTYDYEEILMAKAAWYYYCDNLTQQQISERLGVNRMRVIKLLEKAKLSGIIQFQIRSDSKKRMELEQSLMATYGLQDCFVVPTPSDYADTNENVAMAASMYMCNRMDGEAFINVGYGDTSSRILNYLAINTPHTINCVSLTGGVSYYLPNANSSIFNCRLYLIPSPLMTSSVEMAAAIKAEKSVKEIEQLIPLSTFTIVGIGAMNDDATIVKSGIVTMNDFLFLKRNGAVGDILSHFIDANGEVVASEMEDRTISTSLSTLKNLNNVVGVAAGLNKVDAIRSVLKGKYIDVLITDEETALALMQENV